MCKISISTLNYLRETRLIGIPIFKKNGRIQLLVGLLNIFEASNLLVMSST